MAHPISHRTIQSTLKQLRLIAGRSIFRNAEHILSLHTDIDAADDLLELCDEYSFRILCDWISTKCSSLKYTPSIDPAFDQFPQTLQNVLSQYSEYPFSNCIQLGQCNTARHAAFAMLDKTVEPSLALLGSLYEQIVNYPLQLLLQSQDDDKPLGAGTQQAQAMHGISPARGSEANQLPDHNRTSCIAINIQVKDKRRLSGQFYTPPSVVRYCIETGLGKDKDKFMKAVKSGCNTEGDWSLESPEESLRILDPSCGSGNFLIGLLDLTKPLELSFTERISYASSCLFGIEIDGRAASICRTSILLALADDFRLLAKQEGWSAAEIAISGVLDSLRKNIVVSDTIFYSPTDQNGIKGCSGSTIFQEEKFDKKKFDLVITNPPYISFGARNQPKLPDSNARFFKQKFPASAEYKIRFHSIFQEIALRYAKTGGRVVLLVPDGFLTGGYYQRLRKLILSNAAIDSVSELPDDTIPGAVVGRWSVASYIKGLKNAQHDKVQLHAITKSDRSSSSYSVPFSLFISPDRNRFRLIFTDLDRDICLKTDSLPPLSTYLRGHTGMRALKGQGAITGLAKCSDSWRQGLRSGGSVSSHFCVWDGTWLNVDPLLLYSGGFNKDVVEAPKLLVRQTGDRIVAALDQSGLYHLNNVHSFSPFGSAQPGSKVDLNYLDGLMNSTMLLYLYRLKTREQGRALAQIDIETLESITVPRRDELRELMIGRLVKAFRIIHTSSRNSERLIQRSPNTTTAHDHPESAAAMPCIARYPAQHSRNGMLAQIDRAIDRVVYELYLLDEESVKHVESCCAKELSSSAAKLPEIDQVVGLLDILDAYGTEEDENKICRALSRVFPK